MRPLIRSTKHREVRVLRPDEWEELRRCVLDDDTRDLLTALLLTGMRYAELQRFRGNSAWLEGRFVKLPKGAALKVEARQRERDIRLSDMGVTLVPELFHVTGPAPQLPALDMYLRRLSRRMGLEGQPITNKTFRKTWESWLTYYFPDRVTHIALSQGHTTITQLNHYLNMSFDQDDRKIMRKWVEGWWQE